MKATLARRIATLQRDFNRARLEGRDTQSFKRRAKTLWDAYRSIEEDAS